MQGACPQQCPCLARAGNARCSTDAPWCEAAAKEFTKKTGIKVNQAHKGTGAPFLQAAEQGLLAEYRPAYINDLRDWRVRQYAMPGNQVGGFYSSTTGFGYNTD